MEGYDFDLDEGEVTFKSVSDTLILDQEREEDEDLTQFEYELSPHEKCAAHTLKFNLVASSDVGKCLSSSSLSRGIYRNSFAKCSALWKKASRLTQAADQVEQVLKRKLIVPSPTHWNSYFDAVLIIL